MLKIFKSFFKNKKVLFFVIGLGLFLFLLPWQCVEADPIITGPDGTTYNLCEGCGPWPHEWPSCIVCFVLYIASLPARIIFAVIVGIIGLLALVAGLFYAVTAAIINWLIGVIMTVGVVPGNPLTPGIVEIGWIFSRDFANLFFLLALAFIGLATILRIKEYEMKKALPTLIIIALLINFTPVIVGFVVDMGNIVTKFFLDHAGSIDTLGDTLHMATDYLSHSLARLFLEDGEFFQKFPEIILKFLFITVYGIVLLGFFAFATFIYLLIGAVFLFRTVILWILMILSPIAFLSKVFPNTKTTKMVFPDILHWDKWWEKLIQWTVIGIPISFFLYLSNLIMSATYRTEVEGIFDITSLGVTLEETASSTYSFTSTSTEFISEISGLQAGFVDLFAALFAPTIAIVLLGMGALISLKAVPEGAQGIMRFTHERGIKRGWSGITAGIAAATRSRQTYRTQIDIAGQTRGQAVRHTLSQPIRETWRTWRKRPAPSAPPVASATGQTDAEAPWAVDQGAGPEEFLPPKPSTPPPTAPPVSRHRARATKVGKGALGFFIKVPAKIGWRAATGVLRAAESMATAKIGKELKAKKENGQKTCSNPTCREEILADAKFCPKCGQAQS